MQRINLNYKNLKLFLGLLLIISIFLRPTSLASQEDYLEDGYYSLELSLWHAQEDRPSMGNGAVVQVGEIEVIDGQAVLYVGAEKMEVMSITASLVNLYYEDENGNYRPTDRGAFEIEVPGEHQKRPRVLRFPIDELKEYYNVMVDPKVEPMGDAPIGARLKLNLETLKKISKDESKLIEKFKNGPPKPDFNPDEPGIRSDKTMVLHYPGGAFDQDFTFYANKLVGDDQKEYREDFDPLAKVEFYNFECLGPLKIIQKGQRDIQNTRVKYQPNLPVEITIPLKDIGEEDKLTLYKLGLGSKEVIDYSISDGKLTFKTSQLGDFAIEAGTNQEGPVAGGSSGEEIINKGGEENKKPPSQGQVKKQSHQPRQASNKKTNPGKVVKSNKQGSQIKANENQAKSEGVKGASKPVDGQLAPENIAKGQEENTSSITTNVPTFSSAAGQASNLLEDESFVEGQNLGENERPNEIWRKSEERPLIIIFGLGTMAGLIIYSLFIIKENGKKILDLKEEERFIKEESQADTYEE